jgi:hypothetical protein
VRGSEARDIDLDTDGAMSGAHSQTLDLGGYAAAIQPGGHQLLELKHADTNLLLLVPKQAQLPVLLKAAVDLFELKGGKGVHTCETEGHGSFELR